MKRIVILACLLLLTAITSIASAAQSDFPKPKVAVLFENNAKTTFDDAIGYYVTAGLRRAIPTQEYSYVDANPALARMREMGITDFSTAERRDIIECLNGLNIDYLIYLEVQPMVRKVKFHGFVHGIEMVTQAPFKIIDIANDRYLYQGKFVEKGTTGTMTTPIFLLLGNKKPTYDALTKVLGKVKMVVEERLPKTKDGVVTESGKFIW